MQNNLARDVRVADLRARLATLGGSRSGVAGIAQDQPPAAWAPRTLHDLYAAAPADAVSANAFGLGLAVEAAAGRPVVWGLHDMTAHEAGCPYAPGLNEMGLRPQDLLLVRTRDIQSLLTVGEEALHSPAVGAVVLSAWGEARAISLTASRRLYLAAQASAAIVFLVRAAALPAPSAAETRWSVQAAPSIPLQANAPGLPAFSVTLLRRRGGGAPKTCIMEWDRGRRAFIERAVGSTPLSGGLVPLAAQRPDGARERQLRRTG